ncbi:MAG: hypothetical protein KAT32_02200 [Candidatus Moranbacteria bacterium]|nr:hypothetical protein [Candidatus Moranbacteria bacterium]
MVAAIKSSNTLDLKRLDFIQRKIFDVDNNEEKNNVELEKGIVELPKLDEEVYFKRKKRPKFKIN